MVEYVHTILICENNVKKEFTGVEGLVSPGP